MAPQMLSLHYSNFAYSLLLINFFALKQRIKILIITIFIVNKNLPGLLFGSIYHHFTFFGNDYLFTCFLLLLEIMLFNTVRT